MNGETYTEKNYGGLEPVITLVWMVDDTLNFTDDFIAFTTLPEAAKDFITNEDLWNQPFETILAERKKTLKILKNGTKDLGFFSENRLIYAFQKNIITNKLITKYFKWFDFASKSRNFNNIKEDFSHFNNDDIMAEVIKRLKRERLPLEEYKFVSDLPLYEAFFANQQLDIEAMAEKAKKADKRAQRAQERLKLAEAKIGEAEAKIGEAEAKTGEAQQMLLKGIENLLKRGDTVESIAELLMRSVEDITALVAQIHSQKP